MPGITITPGVFNPVATPAEVGRLLTFPRTVAATVPRRWMQFQTRGGAVPEIPAPQVNSHFRDYFSGACMVKVPQELTPSSINVTGVRYVEDGTYSVSSSNISGGETFLRFSVGPWERTQQVIALGDVDMIVHHVTGVGSRAYLFVQLNYAVSILAATDGAVYTVSVIAAGETALGTSGTLDLGLTGYFGSGAVGGAFDITYDIAINLLRDGNTFETVSARLKFTGNAIPVTGDELAPGADFSTNTPAPTGLAETLYGGDTIMPTITGPAIQLQAYTRTSQAIQGTVSPV